MKHKGNPSRVSSFLAAFRGLRLAFMSEVNLRIHSLATLVVIAMGAYYQIALIEWLIVLLCIGWVVSLELINTAIEYLSNRVTEAHDVQIKAVKDVASASVLLASLVACSIACLIFIPKIIAYQ